MPERINSVICILLKLIIGSGFDANICARWLYRDMSVGARLGKLANSYLYRRCWGLGVYFCIVFSHILAPRDDVASQTHLFKWDVKQIQICCRVRVRRARRNRKMIKNNARNMWRCLAFLYNLYNLHTNVLLSEDGPESETRAK